MNDILSIRCFSKSYPGTPDAVKDVTLSIRPGDIMGFIGKNGSGKTTTLRACAGVLHFTQGDILVDGLSIREDPVACKKRIAYIPDNPDLYEFLTGRQYLDFIADVFEVPRQKRLERMAYYAGALQLEDRLQDLVGAYSHGMKQKLSMMGGFLHDPLLFLMDEPFVGLDPEAVVRVRQMIRDFCAKGSAVFFSTHVLEVAEKLCNRIAIINRGQLAALGDTADVRGESSLESYFLEVMGDA